MRFKLSIITVVFVGLFGAFAQTANASEGFFDLRNQVGEAARCHVTSGIMENQRYSLLTLCRDILYPGGTEVFHYVAWANPVDGGNPIRLGELGLGKQLFSANEAFNSIFVTKELAARPRTPSSDVIMRGNLQKIEFLDNASSATNIAPELGQPTATPEAQAQRSNIFRTIAAGSVITFLAIFAVIAVIFVITRR